MCKQFFLLVTFFLTACTPASLPAPIQANIGEEFTLTPGQSATTSESDLTMTLLSVPTDGRCPLEIECAMSGPVSLNISIQNAENSPSEFALQTFTGSDGRIPENPFEGIQNRMEFEGYIIQVKSVLPYPLKHSSEIKDSEYQVSFIVTPK